MNLNVHLHAHLRLGDTQTTRSNKIAQQHTSGVTRRCMSVAAVVVVLEVIILIQEEQT